MAAKGGLRERVARVLWRSHPARPGPAYAGLKESQWWTQEQLEAHQAKALRRLMSVAAKVPFYRDQFTAAKIGAGGIASIADLSRVPILERTDLERLGIAGLRVPGTRGMRAHSSGSLGKPVEILWPLEQMRWLDAGEARARAWLGSDVGDRRLEVRCRPVGFAQAVNAVLLNTAAFHAPTIADPAVVRRLVDEMIARPPTLIWGVSNALYVVALALLDLKRPIRAGACWSGGNHLHSHYRKAMEEAFGCKVYERYATIENGLVAHECVEGGQLHVPAEGLMVEIVRADGTAVGPGEMGDVLVTSLHNTATPLIRYRVGDQAIAPKDPRCSCGRGLPVFGTVAGRTRDFLRTQGGRLVGPAEVVEVVGPGTNSVVDFQVVQGKDLGVRVYLLQRDSAEAEGDRVRIGAAVERLMGGGGKVGVERVGQIALTPGGKLRTIISEVAT